jgi:hypothetical protein
MYFPLSDMARPGRYKANPTIAAGDFKLSQMDGALSPLATTPTVSPAGSIWVKVTISTAEMATGVAKVQCLDLTEPPEWADFAISIPTTA